MTDMNNVNIIGRVTRAIEDEDYHVFNSGVGKIRFQIVVNRSFKQNGETVELASF